MKWGSFFVEPVDWAASEEKRERGDKNSNNFRFNSESEKKLNPDVLANILNESERWEKCNWLIAVQAYLSIN